MNKEQFWALIEEAKRQAAGELEAFAPALTQQLEALEPEDILLFQTIFEQYYELCNKSKLWAAGYLVNGGCSDDGFDYFRGWLIAQGKQVYLNALRDPDSLTDTDIRDDNCELEEILSGCAISAYIKRVGSSGNEMDDYDTFYTDLNMLELTEDALAQLKAEIVYAPYIDAPWEEDQLEALLPRLYAKCEW